MKIKESFPATFRESVVLCHVEFWLRDGSSEQADGHGSTVEQAREQAYVNLANKLADRLDRLVVPTQL